MGSYSSIDALRQRKETCKNLQPSFVWSSMMAYIAPHLKSFDRDPLLIVLNNILEDTISIQDIHYDDFDFQDIQFRVICHVKFISI